MIATFRVTRRFAGGVSTLTAGFLAGVGYKRNITGQRWLAVAFGTMLSVSPSIASASTAVAPPFDVDDYFALQRFAEVALSPDARLLAYVAERRSISENRTVRQTFVGPVGATKGFALPHAVAQGRAFAWLSTGQRLAFLADVDGISQVLSFDVQSGQVTKHTRAELPIARFTFAADGQSLAFVTAAPPSKSFYDKLRDSPAGLIADMRSLTIMSFLTADFEPWSDAESEVWIKPNGVARAARIAVPGSVYSAHWSPRGDRLSVSFRPRTDLRRRNPYSASLAVYEAGPDRLTIVAEAHARADGRIVSYTGGEWQGERMLVRRTIVDDLWNDPHFPVLAAIDPQAGAAARDDMVWRAIGAVSPFADVSGAFTARPGGTFIARAVSGRRQLDQIDEAGKVRPVALCRGLTGDADRFSISADGRAIAFVSESLARPPELYLSVAGRCRALTTLNAPLGNRVVPEVRPLTWSGRDGTQVHGWLLQPRGRAQPWPLVTYVHGGPAMPMTDAFEGGFALWPHPLAALASRGIAVFIPNYRGTAGYGRSFLTPSRIDGEPLDDIERGIDALIEEGIADRDKLGIIGHSHGTWLAALLVARTNRFRAASLSEGIPSAQLAYDLMPETLNRTVHDRIYGGPPEGDPAHYARLSADLSLTSGSTAILAEAGARSVAPALASFVKAARRRGAPSEFVIYPRTGHNLTEPQLMREAATRNLDWFAFWLTGAVDPDPAKAEQYVRWRAGGGSAED